MDKTNVYRIQSVTFIYNIDIYFKGPETMNAESSEIILLYTEMSVYFKGTSKNSAHKVQWGHINI